MRKIIHCYSQNRDGYGVLAANKNELATRAFERVSVLGVVVLGAGAVSWLRARVQDGQRRGLGAGAAAGVLSWQSAPALVSADCACCGKLAVQAAYILVPASLMSTGRGILPNYLGLC